MNKILSIKRGLLSALIILFSLATTLAVEVTVNFTTSTGDPIEGAPVSFRQGSNSLVNIGITDVNGQIFADLGAVVGNATFQLEYDGASQRKSQNVNANPIVNFATILATFKVVDLDENELVGTNAIYSSGGWKTFGSGTTTTQQEMLSATYPFRVTYNGVVKSVTKRISNANNEVVISIKLANVVLLDSDGNSIESDDIKYLLNGTWQQFGDGVTPESVEVLPSNLWFRVFYNGAYQEIQQNIGNDQTVVFQTVSLDYQSSGTVDYSFNGGVNIPLNGATELLPVKYKFRFSEAGYSNRYLTKTLNESEEKSLAYIKFANSLNEPIVGADVEYYLGDWQSGQLTDDEGVSFNLIDGIHTDLDVKINLGGASNEITQDISFDSYFDFTTINVTMYLFSEFGDELESENAEYNAGGWNQFGDGVTTESVEMLSGNYDFRIHLGGNSAHKFQDIAIDPIIVFNTISVTMDLFSSEGDPLESSDAKYWSDAWYQFGDGVTSETINMLPGTYDFRVFFSGAIDQKNQNISLDPNVIFNTVAVTVELHDGIGNELTSDNVTYFITGNGWNQFGDGITTVTADLLPSFYDFRVYYNDEVMQMAQSIGTNNLVSFVYNGELEASIIPGNDDFLTSDISTSYNTNNSGINERNLIDDNTISFSTKGNYPNPFSNSTIIEYVVLSKSSVQLTIHDLNGKVVKTLLNKDVYPGTYRIEFDGNDQNGNLLPAGMYIYKLTSSNFQESKRLIIQR